MTGSGTERLSNLPRVTQLEFVPGSDWLRSSCPVYQPGGTKCPGSWLVLGPSKKVSWRGWLWPILLLLLFRCSVVSDSLWPCGLKHARLPCLWPSARTCSTSCPLSQWCYATISLSVALSPPALNLSQHQGLFQWVGSLQWVAKVLGLQL